MTNAAMLEQVSAQLDRLAFHPAHIRTHLKSMLFDEPIVASFVNMQSTFENAEVARYVVLFVLTPTRLLHLYASEAPFPESDRALHVEVHSVALHALHSVRNIYGHASDDSPTEEIVFAIGWGDASRVMVDVGPCPDPECDMVHGNGGLAHEDVVLRLSVEADGSEKIREAEAFIQQLRRAQLEQLRGR
ncbi:MAG: DUF5998 family protein [Bowdeniella nasicola]|nr:DUF5998 family protein [Bowdeniella nasicola]